MQLPCSAVPLQPLLMRVITVRVTHMLGRHGARLEVAVDTSHGSGRRLRSEIWHWVVSAELYGLAVKWEELGMANVIECCEQPLGVPA